MMPRRYNRPSGEKQTVSGSDEVLKLLGTTEAMAQISQKTTFLEPILEWIPTRTFKCE
ncbi:uncharacterized protein LOC142817436 isoform X4 [Rhipicephalus microplus]|uniref:uncharacterized protein LOC142817436 isoform X4 n=1 Tax=Rhipicephalus microplus TaxID=6941 RepID=UPI003F6BA782